MDREKLIESVKSCEALYVISHSRYGDSGFKENAWRTIAREMNQSAAVCKKTWTSLRDSYRRALKKKRETKTGQAALKMKKWTFEDEMSFLLPYMQERDTCTNLREVCADDQDDEQNKNERNDKDDDRDDGRNDRNDDKDRDNYDDGDENESITDNEKTKKSKLNRNTDTKVGRNKANEPQAKSETASAVVSKYLLEKKIANASITPPTKHPSAIETFFSSIATTVDNFSPYYQNIAKSKIFAIVTDLEMQQIMQEQQFCCPIHLRDDHIAHT